MGEKPTTDSILRHLPTPPASDRGTPFELEPGGPAHRIDPAHRPQVSTGGTSDPAPAAFDHSLLRSRPTEQELLLQASQIAEHLRAQFAELDRREQRLNEKLALLDHERRNARLWIDERQEELAEREARMTARETEFAERLATCERLVGELEAQEQALRAREQELQDQRANLSEHVERELLIKREELEQERDQLESDRADLRAEVEQIVRQEHAEFLRARDEWTALRDAELAEIHKERELIDTALSRAQAELRAREEAFDDETGRLRKEQRERLESERVEQERELADARRRAEEEIAQARATWDSERRAEADRLTADLAAAEQRLEQIRTECAQRRVDQDAEIEAERRKVSDQQSQQLRIAQQELTVVENRIRFQQEHLQKARRELEQDKIELDRRRQQVHVGTLQTQELLRLRLNQLEHFRQLLDEREKSIERERDMAVDLRATLESELEQDRLRITRERDAWEQERDAQRAELRRQQDMLALHAENLETRRARLDHLRAELEETHRGTLEMRMAVEEAWAQFSQAAGSETAQARVEQARQAFLAHYSHLAADAERQKREVDETLDQLHEQREAFQAERKELTEWVAERDQKLNLWEQQLRRDSEELETRDAAWRAARDVWTREKIEAEQIIRDLLTQVASLQSTSDSHIEPLLDSPPIEGTEDAHSAVPKPHSLTIQALKDSVKIRSRS